MIDLQCDVCKKGLNMIKQYFRDGNRIPHAALEIIESYFNRVARPVYLGTISLEIGWSLASTQEMFDYLHDIGTIRPMKTDEKIVLGFTSGANIYVLTTKPVLAKAWR